MMTALATGASSRRTPAPRIDGSTWETYRDYIKFLYVDENKTLEEVRQSLEREMGFTATKAQYHHMIYEVWKFKKTLSREDALFIEAEKNKRKREGKDTIVKVAGRVVHDEELKRKKPRYHVSELERHQRRLANQLQDNIEEATGYVPADIELVTPSPPSSLLSPQAYRVAASMLEWTDPVNNIRVSPNIGFPSLSPRCTIFSPSTPETIFPLAFQSSLAHTVPTMQFEIMFENQMNALFKEPSSYLFANSQNNSVLRLVLSSEPVSDPAIWMAEVLTENKERGFRPMDLMLFLKSYMIRVSNKIDNRFHQRQCLDLLLRSGELRKHAGTLEMILKERETTEGNSPLKLSTAPEATDDLEAFRLVIKNFAAELLYSAARTGDMDILKLIVRLGILKAPGDECIESETIGVTAIQFAIEYKQKAAWKFLLSQKVNVNRAPISDLSPSLLWTAVLVDNPDLVSDLIERGADDYPRVEKTKLSPFLNYVRELKDDGLAWARSLNISNYTFHKDNALRLSVAASRPACFRVLARKHAQKDRRFSKKRPQWGILHMAAMNRDHAMMSEIVSQPIYSGRIDDKARWVKGATEILYTALSPAILNEDVTAIEILVENGADPQNVALDFFEVVSVDLEKIIGSRSPGDKLPLKDRLERRGLVQVVKRIEKLISQRKEQAAWDALFSDSSDQEDNDYEIYWSYGFPMLSRDSAMTTAQKLIDMLYNEDFKAESRVFLVIMQLTLGFIEHLEVSIRTDPIEKDGQIVVGFRGKLFNHDDIKPFFSKLGELFDGLWASHILSFKLSLEYIDFGLPLLSRSKKRREAIQKFLDGYGNASEYVTREPLIMRLDAFCFEQKTTTDRGKVLGTDFRHRYQSQKAGKLLLNLEKNFDKYGKELLYILEWSRCVPDKSFRKRLCDISASHISELDHRQICYLLKLAVYGDFHEVVESILANDGSLQIPNDLVVEATCFSSIKTFNFVFDHYIAGPNPELEIPFFSAIILGHLDKVVKIATKVDINYSTLAKTTAIEIAAVLGRLDITTELLQAGASENLDKAQRIAMERGHFTLHKIISKAIESRNGNDGGSAVSDTNGAPLTSSPKKTGSQPNESTLAPAAADLQNGGEAAILDDPLEWAANNPFEL